MKKIIANHIPSILLREIQRMSFDRLKKNPNLLSYQPPKAIQISQPGASESTKRPSPIQDPG